MKRILFCSIAIVVLAFSTLNFASAQPEADLLIELTCTHLSYTGSSDVRWNMTVINTGNVSLTNVNVSDTLHGFHGTIGLLNPGAKTEFITDETLLPGTTSNHATAIGYYQPTDLYLAYALIVDCIVEPTIESSDSTGVRKDTFSTGEDLYVNGTGYEDAIYHFGTNVFPLYVVEDQIWSDNMTIPTRVPGTATTVTAPSGGIIPPTLVWTNPLTPGKYDIVVDANFNGRYDLGIDAIDDNDIMVTAGFFVVPEVAIGSVMAIASMFAALGLYAYKKKHKPTK